MADTALRSPATGGHLPSRRRFVRGALALGATPLLAACGLFTRPRPDTVPPTPTPRPTPTLAPTLAPSGSPRPVSLPTPASPAATVAAPATPRPAPALRDAGSLLCLGALAGAAGIIAVDADGGDPRLLAPGAYDALDWTPDGDRFAATGPLAIGGSATQVALFAADGRALARFPLEGSVIAPPRWSPDGARLVCHLLTVAAVTGANPTLAPGATLLVDAAGVRAVDAPADLIPWGWTPTGRLALLTVTERATGRVDAANPRIVWTVNAAGGDLRREAGGAFYPLGWSADGATLYAAGALRDSGLPGYVVPLPSALLAIDTRTGDERVVVTAAALAGVPGAATPAPGAVHTFGGWSLAPGGAACALWVQAGHGAGTPVSAPVAQETALVLVDAAGRPLARAAMPAGLPVFELAWAPVGVALAYSGPAIGAVGDEVRILAAGGAPPLAYPLAGTGPSRRGTLAWSPDGRWLAHPGQGGLTIAATGGPAWSTALGLVGTNPAWRPGTRP